MKSGSGLIVLQTLEDGAIDDDFVVLNLSTDDADKNKAVYSTVRRVRMGMGNYAV